MLHGKRQHLRILALICLACSGLTLIPFLLGPGNRFRVQWTAFDIKLKDWIAMRGRRAVADPRLIYMAIDQPSVTLDPLFPDEIEQSEALKLMKQGFPWSRAVYAMIIERLVQAGAKVVAFDLLFPAPQLGGGDEIMRAALEKYRDRVVIGCNFADVDQRMQNSLNLAMPTTTLIDQRKIGEPLDDRIGYVNFWPDQRSDEIIRRAHFRRTSQEINGIASASGVEAFESFGARAIRKAGFGHLLESESKGRLMRYAIGAESLKPHSIYEIFIPEYWKTNYQDGEFFRDKIVLVGPEGHWSKDLALSPFGEISGPQFHLNAMNALLSGEFLEEASDHTNKLLIVGGGLMAWLLCFFVRNPLWRMVLLFVLIGSWMGLALVAYNRGFSILIFSPLFAMVSSGGIFSVAEQVLERVERNRLRRTFERYVSRDVVKELLDNPESYLNTLVGQRKKISILFSDVRGFTSMTENADPHELVGQLNEYFNEMVGIVFTNHGTLDKFIGDAVVAQWGGIRTEGVPMDARRAVATAVQMRRALVRLNEGWRARGRKEIKIGIGINHGEAIVGNLGCEAKMEVTAIGDAVNLASRLEGATKQFQTDFLIGETLVDLVREDFVLQTIDFIQVKGKSKPVEVFTVLGERAENSEPGWLARYEEGVGFYRTRQFAEAKACMSEVLAVHQDCWMVGEYIRRCEDYLETPPADDWDGVYVMRTK